MLSDRTMHLGRVGLAILLSVLLTTVGSYAQDRSLEELDERVKELEERVRDDESPWDSYVSEFGGRLMADFTFNTGQSDALRSGLGQAEDGFEFRRLRLYTEGPIGEAIDYKLQLDFAGTLGGGAVDLKDAYVSVEDLGVLPDLKIGHFKEPFSLNELTSSKYITFMARSALSDGFTPEFNPGIQTAFHAPKAHFTVGVFNQQDGQSPATDGSYNVSGRLTSPVHYANDGRSLIHLGLAGRLSADQSGRFERDLEPEVHKGDPEYLEVSFPSQNHTAVGLEAAAVIGPFSLQSEWAQQSVSTPSGSVDPDLSSYYAFASFLLTGEHRPYDREDGDFGRIKPNAPFTGAGQSDNGPGAWEVAARWSNTDFTEARPVNTAAATPSAGSATPSEMASEMDILTLGLNWYPHAHAKWMLNYVDAEQQALGGDAQWVTSRFQVDF